MSTDDNYDEEMQMVAHEVTWGDPGHLGDDEPDEVRPLCTRCVRDLPDGDDGLCVFCRQRTPQ